MSANFGKTQQHAASAGKTTPPKNTYAQRQTVELLLDAPTHHTTVITASMVDTNPSTTRAQKKSRQTSTQPKQTSCQSHDQTPPHGQYNKKERPHSEQSTAPHQHVNLLLKLCPIGSNYPLQPTVGINTARHIRNTPPRTLDNISQHLPKVHRIRHILLSSPGQILYIHPKGH